MSINNVGFESVHKYGIGLKSISQVVEYDDFTDGLSTSGTLNMTKTIPAHSMILGCKAVVSTGFTGDTTATLAVGDSGDANMYSAGATVNVYTAATVGACAASSGTTVGPYYVSSATTIKLTVTGTADFTSISAGKMTVTVFYFSTTNSDV